jgi:hypothetical protein
MSTDTLSAEPTMRPPASGVTVRLYNPGFGDCLLLAFPGVDGRGRYMLVDCGIHHQYPTREDDEFRKDRMQAIARDIAAATANHLHVVAATHEHTDHLYGFKYAGETFEGMEIDELWLAWTEDPDDADARHLKDTFGLRLAGLGAAVRQLGTARAPLADAIGRVLGFEYPGALAASGGNAAQLQFLRDKSAKPLQTSQDYRHPGEAPLAVPGVPGVKVYVLGPPKEEEWIKRLESASEMYPELAAVDESSAFAAAALAAELSPEEQSDLFRASLPFDQTLMIRRQDAPAHPQYGHFFRSTYGFSGRNGHGPAWRRIDTDWLSAAEQLALALNKKTNNTSLVLAIELTGSPSRPVLLFAADAQVGNWLSWYEHSWPGEGPEGGTVTIEELLRHTVLYKVGHHGSRNATLRAKGLEQMVSPDLVALLPVDQVWANSVGWEHPATKLLEQLCLQAKGRIVRSDRIPAGDDPPPRPAQATEEQWQAFVQHLDWDRSPDRLWIQYTVE